MNFRIRLRWQNLIPLIDNALSGQDDYGEKELWWLWAILNNLFTGRGGKAEQFIELSKDKNPFNNPDKNWNIWIKLPKLFTSNWFQWIFKLISEQFEHPDYKDLYENHSHQKK
jgi:hypothetical protein